MSTEISAQDLSRMREKQMINAAVKRGFTPDELDELETKSLKTAHAKKKPHPAKKVRSWNTWD